MIGVPRAAGLGRTDRLRGGKHIDLNTNRDIPLTSFAELGALPEIVQALSDAGITDAFPIQEQTLPIALTGTDLIGQARTGTGKTLAFAIPVLQRILSPQDPDYDEFAAPGKPQALVVTPTRELARQVARDMTTAGSRRGVRILTVYGGVPYEPQLDGLADGVDAVVGTPGRLLDLAQRHALDLSHVKVLILDEADEMLDLGFLPDVERLITKTPEFRQTMLFSATMRGEVVGLARTYMRHPVNVRAESSTETEMVPTTAQFVYQTHDMDKIEVLARVLQSENRGRTMVFTPTKRQAQRVADDLKDRGFPAAPLHGDMAQEARERTMRRFRDDKVEILVATDVAARGIDVEAVTHVVNYSCPDDEKEYVHRIGRTGRAGASGVAITFVSWPDITRWKVINKALGLPYEEPLETYSTSEHLYHDQGIPSGTKGRLKPASSAPARRSGGSRSRNDGGSRSRGRSRGQGGARRTGSAKQRSGDGNREKPESGQGSTAGSGRSRRRSRNRRRTRGGKPVNRD